MRLEPQVHKDLSAPPVLQEQLVQPEQPAPKVPLDRVVVHHSLPELQVRFRSTLRLEPRSSRIASHLPT